MGHTLCTGIGKLGQCGMEQLILFPERLILLIDVGGRHLESHILIRDLGDIRDEKDARETKDEDTDG